MDPHDWSCGRNGDYECCVCHAWSPGLKSQPPASLPCPGMDPGDYHTYDFISDPGHGWIKIPYSHLLWLNIQDDITGYSYLYNDYAYIEEDADALTFMNAAKKANWVIKYNEIYDPNGGLRAFPSFRVIKL